MHLLRLTIFALLAIFSISAAAAGRQEPAAIQKAVENFVRSQTAGLPGQIALTVAPIDPRLNLPACPVPEPFLPSGGRLWGSSTVGVRCSGASQWVIYVPVTVRVMADVVMTARPLSQGQVVGPADIMLRSNDLAQMPSGVITEASQAVGKTLLNSVTSGQPLRQDMLRSPQVILQGQTVKLMSAGRGFKVSAEGRALSNAAEGQLVQVRTPSGQVISGIARAGAVVEVSY